MLTELFKNIANSIRAVTGSTREIKASEFATSIEEIVTGKYVSGYSAYISGSTRTLSIPIIIGKNYFVLYATKPGGAANFDLVTCINYSAGEQQYCWFEAIDGSIHNNITSGNVTIDFANGTITMIESIRGAPNFTGTYFAVAWG